jgi:hypothetical protein
MRKAQLRVIDPPSRGDGKPGGTRDTIELTFNPKELTVKRAAKYEAKSTKKDQPPQYQGVEPGSISVEVFLDRELCPKGVPQTVTSLFACLDPVDQSQANNPAPPYVVFGWGSITYITGVVKSVTAKYTLFDPEGVPIRAVCTVEIQEAVASPAKTNPTSGGVAPRRAHTVTTADTLMSIAQREYAKPAFWRAVAIANGIDDPLKLTPGDTLLLPLPEEAVELA